VLHLLRWSWMMGLALAPWLSSPAEAQAPESNEPPAYRATVEQAVEEYDAKHFDEALTLFVRAHEIYPNARTLRGAGMAEFELRHYDESAQNLQAALDSKERPLVGALREQTAALLARARGFLATVTLTFEPTSAQLTVDGLEVPASPRLSLRIGEHVLRASAPGHRGETEILRVRGGEELRIDFKLQPNLMAVAPVEQEPRLYKNPWLWTAVGVVVVGAVVTGTLLATRDAGESRLVGRGTGNSVDGFSLSSLLGAR
jgi:tetratricopeptide (TPR) repeat protein